MNLKKLAILFVALDFAALTALALWTQGLSGMIQLATGSWMGITLTTDLCLALTMVSVALYRDARSSGTSPWPFLLLTFATGSLGPLLYLVLRKEPEAELRPLAAGVAV